MLQSNHESAAPGRNIGGHCMNAGDNSFKTPSIVRRGDGEVRLVGFELEFTGLTLDQTVAALQSALGAQVISGSAAEKKLHVESLGRFSVEVDWDYFKRQAARQQGEEEDEWVQLLGQAAKLLVPMEVVCPPLPITSLTALDPMVVALRDAGAQGTEDSPIAAYGVHINPEIPSLDSAAIAAYLKAFSLLQWWLVERLQVDVTRRISPYIDLYPESYVRQLLSDPAPNLDRLFIDYLAYNPTRNRALDMLPLLTEIDGERVRRAVDDGRIQARPTFHYRLPNSLIDRPDWSLAVPWNSWWVVEELACRPDDIERLSAAYLDAWRPLLGVSRHDWIETMEQWIQDSGLA
ncbi:amidoligase family protein [Hahella sp. CR1]|uniref:amidoligase family protein n=1 Tax=Hahella sp. CR1 TaxID=2992807 RepID=UPI0024410FED|nr:amidoligase family protein [Hahella sp. CR1]MDG9670423.1 amidoligase family protein [Hahella sp. CR1]